MRSCYKHLNVRLNTDPFLGEKGGVKVKRDLIDYIREKFSGIEYAFHPSYLSQAEESNQFESWKHLIHIHIQKCAGTNFIKPLEELRTLFLNNVQSNKHSNFADLKHKNYLWHGNLGGKCNHDAFMLEAFQGKGINNLQGSLFANHSGKHGIYCQHLSEAGIYPKKICIVRIRRSACTPT